MRPPHGWSRWRTPNGVSASTTADWTAGVDPTGYGAAPPGFGDQRNYELLIEAGFTPVEAIQIMTYNGARILGIDKELGSIAPGKIADLVVINKADIDADARVNLFRVEAEAVQTTVDDAGSLAEVPEIVADYLRLHNLPQRLPVGAAPTVRFVLHQVDRVHQRSQTAAHLLDRLQRRHGQLAGSHASFRQLRLPQLA